MPGFGVGGSWRRGSEGRAQRVLGNSYAGNQRTTPNWNSMNGQQRMVTPERKREPRRSSRRDRRRNDGGGYRPAPVQTPRNVSIEQSNNDISQRLWGEMTKGQERSDLETQRRAQEDRDKSYGITEQLRDSIYGDEGGMWEKYKQSVTDAETPTFSDEMVDRMYGKQRDIMEAQNEGMKQQLMDSMGGVPSGYAMGQASLADMAKSGQLSRGMQDIMEEKALTDRDDAARYRDALDQFTGRKSDIEMNINKQLTDILSNTITAPVETDWSSIDEIMKSLNDPSTTKITYS